MLLQRASRRQAGRTVGAWEGQQLENLPEAMRTTIPVLELLQDVTVPPVPLWAPAHSVAMMLNCSPIVQLYCHKPRGFIRLWPWSQSPQQSPPAPRARPGKQAMGQRSHQTMFQSTSGCNLKQIQNYSSVWISACPVPL